MSSPSSVRWNVEINAERIAGISSWGDKEAALRWAREIIEPTWEKEDPSLWNSVAETFILASQVLQE